MDLACRKCGTLHPSEHYAPDPKASHGKDVRCKRCQALRRRAQIRTPRGRFQGAMDIAKRRSIPWHITFDQYMALVSVPCAYCGGDLPETGMGIDRKDSNADYCIGNVLPCCFACNTAKSYIFTSDEMKNILGPSIRKIRSLRRSRGELEMRPMRGIGSPQKYDIDDPAYHIEKEPDLFDVNP